MEVLYQKRCANFNYIVPEGLRELMSDISREVLRHEPEQMYTFIADYLDALMITRENARVAAKMVNLVTDSGETVVNLLHAIDISRSQADIVATVIQRAFRKYQMRKLADKPRRKSLKCSLLKHISPEEANRCCTIIQRAYFAYKVRRAAAANDDNVNWRMAFANTLREFYKTRPTSQEARMASKLLQAAYKGYYSNRMLKEIVYSLHETRTELLESISSLLDEKSFEEEELQSLKPDSCDDVMINLEPEYRDILTKMQVNMDYDTYSDDTEGRQIYERNIGESEQKEQIDIQLHEYTLDLPTEEAIKYIDSIDLHDLNSFNIEQMGGA